MDIAPWKCHALLLLLFQQHIELKDNGEPFARQFENKLIGKSYFSLKSDIAVYLIEKAQAVVYIYRFDLLKGVELCKCEGISTRGDVV